MILETSQG